MVTFVILWLLQKLPTRRKKLVNIRQRAVDGDNSSVADTLVYMQSMAESSITEDLSRYDFSYSQVCSHPTARRITKLYYKIYYVILCYIMIYYMLYYILYYVIYYSH